MLANDRKIDGDSHSDGSAPDSTHEPESANAASPARSTASLERRTLTDVEVAERLGVSPFTVRAWRFKGIGPRFLKFGRAVRYRPEDVDAYLQLCIVEPLAR